MAEQQRYDPGTIVQPNEPLPNNFLPEHPAKVFVTVCNTSDFSSQEIWYDLTVEHDSFQWTVRRKLSDVAKLAFGLKAYSAFKDVSASRLTDVDDFDAVTKPPSIMNFLHSATGERKNIESVKEDMQQYFDYILAYEIYRGHNSLADFFEVSGFTFRKELGRSKKEGYLQKQSDNCCVSTWSKRWAVLKDKFLMYLDETKQYVEGVFLFDGVSSVVVEKGVFLKLKNSSHTIYLKCMTSEEAINWHDSIESNMENVISEFGGAMGNVHGSFAPARPSVAHWLVDGCDFFSAVADALESAKSEIFITGWTFSPAIFLKRKGELKDEWLLKTIIEKKAASGVKIYILLYNGPGVVVDLGEHYAKYILESLNEENIRVLIHRGLGLENNLFWSHHEKLIIVDQSIAFVSGIDLSFGRWDYHKHPMTDLKTSDDKEESHHWSKCICHPTWKGMDYANDYVKAATGYDKPFEDQLDRRINPRMPWHDVGAVTYHESARDVAKHFIQRWNFAKAKRHRKQAKYAYLLPKVNPTVEEKYSVKVHPDAVKAEVQVLRSAGAWSVGLAETESSIHEAYVRAIKTAKHYVYIENQFFVSIKDDDLVWNKIIEALIERITAAKGTNFRVYVVLPLIPAFEGDFSKDETSEDIQLVTYYQFRSISRGDGSLVGALKNNGFSDEEIKHHISFCGLRQHDVLNGKAISEVLYIHSKLMIVDDKITIVGSANLNDRSMIGTRDSEVALWMRDTELIPSMMDGKHYLAGKFSSNFRKRLFAEFLGLLPHDYDDEVSDFSVERSLSDITSDEFFNNIWEKTARNNNQIYEEVFKPVPTDAVARFSQVDEYRKDIITNEEDKREMLEQVQGYLVKFSTEYLKEEDLYPDADSFLRLIPAEMFT
ncbi:phospholipase D1-like [Styela clava]